MCIINIISIYKYNHGKIEADKIDESIRKESILLIEQADLAIQNSTYAFTIGIIVIIVLSVSGNFVKTGFNKWRHLQNLSDELAELQLKKARKENEDADKDSKLKLILPT